VKGTRPVKTAAIILSGSFFVAATVADYKYIIDTSGTCLPPGILKRPVTRRVPVGTSQLVTRSTRRAVKSCDELTVVSDGVVTSVFMT